MVYGDAGFLVCLMGLVGVIFKCSLRSWEQDATFVGVLLVATQQVPRNGWNNIERDLLDQ